jgi:hypothetical protein
LPAARYWTPRASLWAGSRIWWRSWTRPTSSLHRSFKFAMLTLRAYLVVSVVLLVVKAIQLGGG